MTELQQTYRLSEDEGKALLDKLQSMAQQGKVNLTDLAEGEVKKAIRAAGLVTREEYDLLEKRVAALERHLATMDPPDDPEA